MSLSFVHRSSLLPIEWSIEVFGHSLVINTKSSATHDRTIGGCKTLVACRVQLSHIEGSKKSLALTKLSTQPQVRRVTR
ncbi:hypothetical protein GBA52_020080 [Prunus armeniaca]|nr:hypothetical protein GBA52_020080 [Prunus armeniaca]